MKYKFLVREVLEMFDTFEMFILPVIVLDLLPNMLPLNGGFL